MERSKQRVICKREMIPFDLVIEILMKLPPKSLMRFKSVSKLWSSLICSKYFTNLFLLKASKQPPWRMYMCLESDNTNHKKALLSLSEDVVDTSFVFDQDITMRGLKGTIAHVFRGLMCIIDGPRAKIYNTTTRQLVVLPEIEESNMIVEEQKLKKIMYHIGHDPVHDQYKVVCTVARSNDDQVGDITFLSEHWVLLLLDGSSSRWRKITSTCPQHLPMSQGMSINGCIHYIAFVHLPYAVLVSFDVWSEEMSMVQVDELHENICCPTTELIVYCGKVALVNVRREGKIELWVMEDAEKNIWSMKTLVLNPSQMHLVNGISLTLEGATPKGELILTPKDKTFFYALFYDLEKNHMRKVELKGIPNSHLTKSNAIVVGLDDIQNIMYIKT